jgi:hypothetical protein
MTRNIAINEQYQQLKNSINNASTGINSMLNSFDFTTRGGTSNAKNR